jgi:hypothetical protein
MKMYTEAPVAAGFHGTDIETARRIAETGFDARYETWFTLPDDVYLAKDHGQKNALRAGTKQFAILDVTFPETPKDYSEYGWAVCLSGSEIGHVALTGMDVFDTVTGRLVAVHEFGQAG